VQSITLPDVTPATAANGELEMHLFAMGVSNGSASVPFSSLQAAYNNVGIADSSNPAEANYDGGGYSFSQQALTAAGLAPGTAIQESGATVTWPNVASGQLDNVVAEGQTVDLSGSGANLVFVGAANNGTATGTGTITYTDGSTQSFTITLADWYADSPATGDTLVATTSNWNTPPSSTLGSHQVSVYATAVSLAAGKTIKSVTLPAVSHGVGDSMNAMHIFAVGVGG
jgi:beta-glucosidase